MEKSRQQHETRYENGFALSGGAYRSLGQVGVVKALLEREIKPDIYCGTSTGAMVSVLFSSGYTAQEIFEIWEKEPLGQIFQFRWPKSGFLKPGKIGEIIKPYLRYERLEDLPVPTLICSTCLNDGSQKVFREGDLVKLLEATCAVPVLFEPVEIEGRQYCDGGLVSNLPTEPLKDLCKRLIGVYANPMSEEKRIEGFSQILHRTIWIGLNSTTQKSREFCDWFIAPEGLHEAELIDRSAMEMFYKEGYEHTCRFLDEKGIEKQTE